MNGAKDGWCWTKNVILNQNQVLQNPKSYLKLREKKKKKHFDRESRNPKQKRIKSKPIQQKTQSKSNISYPNLKNGKKAMYGAQSM